MEQLGLKSERWVSEIEKQLSNRNIDRVVGIGPALIAHPIRSVERYSAYPDVASFLRAEPSFPPESSIVLLKGARAFGFERLAEAWAVKKHQTELRIDLNAMAVHLNSIRARLAKKVKLMAVVKASSYGAGGLEVAAMLQFQKVDYLAVAYADEGIELRQSGIVLPIMVMNPEEEALDRMVEYELEPEIYSFRILELFIKALLRSSRSSEPFPIHLKIDTGMHRLGFDLGELASLSAALKGQKALLVKTVFTHLAATEDPSERDRTLAQLQRFEHACSELSRNLEITFWRHALNSAGIENYPNHQYEMVRLGLGLYGLGAALEQAVLSLSTRISQIKWVRKGESVGYGYSFVAERDMRSATLAIGYADGFDRRFSNGVGSVWIKGRKAPIIGKVCMDLCMVDVTEIECAEGDEVEIFGSNIHVEELASRIGTIPYELLTGISPRVKRLYLQG
jgi:alanine racemase